MASLHTHEQRFDDTVAPMRYRIQPLVVLSIMDHFKRRSKQQQHVVGALFAVRDADTIIIRDCFAVPYIQRNDKVSLELDYFASMCDLHSRVCVADVVVGWYCSGSIDKLNSTAVRLHEIFSNIINAPLLLCVDTALTNWRLDIKAYTAETVVESANGESLLTAFEEVILDLDASEEDKIGVDALIQSQPDNDTFDSPATLLSDQRGMSLALESLFSLLADMSEYVESVVRGELIGDVEIGRAIADALSQAPFYDAVSFEESLNNSVSDLLSIAYLTSLTKAQVALADKANLVA